MSRVFKQEAINGILFTLHFYNELPTVAHLKLLQMTGKEVMKLDQITEFFKKIENGEFRLENEVKEVVVEGEQPKVTLAQILNVPDFVEKYLDIVTRLRLRKTCTTIRKIVNEKLLHIACFRYDCDGKNIEMSTYGELDVSYKIIEGGLSLKYWDRVRLINASNDEEKLEIIQRDLMSILGSEKLRIGTFEIENFLKSGFDNRDRRERIPIGLKALRNILNQLPRKLNVKKMMYFDDEVDEALIEIVKAMDTEHLKFLQFSFNRVFREWTPNWEDLYNLEQWKCLKTLKVRFMKLAVQDIIRFYTHFENAHLEIRNFHGHSDNTPLHNFAMIRDKLFQNPTFKQFKIRANNKMLDSDFEDIKASLQQFNTNNAPYPFWVSFTYPDSDKKLEMLVKKNMIWFKGPCYVEGEDSDDDYDYESSEEEDEFWDQFYAGGGRR